MPLQDSNPGALHGVTFDLLGGYEPSPVVPVAGATPLEEGVEYTFSKDGGQSYTYSSALPATVRRVSGLKDNPILNSHTHALHSAYLGNQERDEAKFTFSREGTQETTVVDALYPTQLRAQNLEEDSVKFSHTHALHSVNFNEVPREDATFTFSRDGSQEFTIKNALPPTVNKLRLLNENPVLYSHTHALHGRAGANPTSSEVSYTSGASGDTYNYQSALPPTERRIKQLQDNASNPFLATSTYAQHGVTKDMLSGYQKNPVQPTVNDFLSGYQKNPVQPVAGSQLPGFGVIEKVMKSKDWPLARFFFFVTISGKSMAFQAVDGLEVEIGVIDYRDGNSPFFGKDHVPGMISYSRVTMKKGMFTGDTDANSFFKKLAQDRKYLERHSISITLADANGLPQVTWKFEKAFITKYVPTNLDAEADGDVAIEEVEFVGKAWYTEGLGGILGGASMGGIGGAVAGALNISF